MTRKKTQTAGTVVLKCDETLHLSQTLFCGQCFRWQKESEQQFTGIAMGRRLTLTQTEDTILFHHCTEEEVETVWKPYFDLGTDYRKVQAGLKGNDPVMEQAVQYGSGIHILRQDPWETLCSFIISQNNNIPRIQGIIDRLCSTFGDPIAGGYDFPSPERMAKLTVEDLAPLRSGFRAKYLVSASQMVASGEIDLSPLYTMDLGEARRILQKIHGVGPKVAECVLLYGFHRMECFPMDVWMKRAMALLYPGETGERFGKFAGIAQQYLFHYSREHPELWEE